MKTNVKKPEKCSKSDAVLNKSCAKWRKFDKMRL